MDEFVVRDLADQIKALVGGIHELNDTLGEKYATLTNEDDQPEGYLGANKSPFAGLEQNPVSHPSHYTAYKGVEVIQLTEQMNFNRGNAVKYIARAGLKSAETEIQDLEKAKQYIDFEIARITRNQKDPQKIRPCSLCKGHGELYNGLGFITGSCPKCNKNGVNN